MYEEQREDWTHNECIDFNLPNLYDIPQELLRFPRQNILDLGKIALFYGNFIKLGLSLGSKVDRCIGRPSSRTGWCRCLVFRGLFKPNLLDAKRIISPWCMRTYFVLQPSSIAWSKAREVIWSVKKKRKIEINEAFR